MSMLTPKMQPRTTRAPHPALAEQCENLINTRVGFWMPLYHARLGRNSLDVRKEPILGDGCLQRRRDIRKRAPASPSNNLAWRICPHSIHPRCMWQKPLITCWKRGAGMDGRCQQLGAVWTRSLSRSHVVQARSGYFPWRKCHQGSCRNHVQRGIN